MSSSLGRLGSSVAAATACRRSAAGLQQSTSYSAIHKLVPTSPTTATARPTVSRLSVLVNRTPFSRHFVGRGSASNGSSCGLLRPPRAALAQTTPPQQLAPYTSRSCAAPFAAITTRAFTAHSSSGGFTPSRCNLRQSSPPPSSLLLPQLLVQQQHRYKWDYQEQRRMMSATGGAGDPGAGPRAGAAGVVVFLRVFVFVGVEEGGGWRSTADRDLTALFYMMMGEASIQRKNDCCAVQVFARGPDPVYPRSAPGSQSFMQRSPR